MVFKLQAFQAICVALCIGTTETFDMESDDYVRSVANKLSVLIVGEAKRITNYHKITDTFNELERRGGIVEAKRDPNYLMKLFKYRIEEFFAEKLKILKQLKQKAEIAHHNHVYNASMEPFKYLNMRKIKYSDNASLRIYPPLSTTQRINITNSFIHVPTNIYEYKMDILNAVKWTDELESVFLGKYDGSNGTALTSYYGDQSGIWRVFPGTKISSSDEESDSDFFDCRRRVWYVQASASPKDIVIIIDTSGSMTGANIGIAKITVASLINTLAENDYFNVIMANNEVTYLKPCATFLIQATKENKEAMARALENIPAPSEVVAADNALEEAFKILASGPSFNRLSANCNKAIMFISDGIEGDYVGQRVFEKYNANKTVRAYTFLVGIAKEHIAKEGLLKMSCENRGYYYRIETFGNVWNTVNSYLQVMSRPLNQSKDDIRPNYSPTYLDCCGMGMILTSSIGVFDGEKGLIGVTGTDIPISRINELISHEALGAFGHCLIINNNGFIIFHRNIRTQTGYLPTSRNVLLEDIEYTVGNNYVTTLKIHMIDREENGIMNFPIYWLYDNSTRLVEAKARAYYNTISKTDFSLATIFVDSEIDIYNVTDEEANRWLRRGIDALGLPQGTSNETMKTQVYIEKWEYCEKVATIDKFKALKTYYHSEELKKYLDEVKSVDDIPSDCDEALIKKLLTTAAITSTLVQETWLPEVIESGKYQALFIETLAGYVKYKAVSEEYISQENTFYLSQTFEHAAANPQATISISVPYRKEDHQVTTSALLTMSSAIRVGELKVLIAVSGMKVNSNHLYNMFQDAMNSTSNFWCNDSNTDVCILIDKNGYMVSSNQGNNYLGRFLGEFSAFIVENLNASAMIKRVVLNDTQAECPSVVHIKSSASALFSPLKTLTYLFTCVTHTFNWMLMKSFFLFLTSPSMDASVDDIKITKWVSCTEQMPFYIMQHEMITKKSNRSIISQIECDRDCNMTYYMYPVKDTNLYFMMVKIKDGCRTQCTKLRISLRRIRVLENDICKSEQPYRRGPNNCFNQSIPNENRMCGKAHLLIPSFFILIPAILVALTI